MELHSSSNGQGRTWHLKSSISVARGKRGPCVKACAWLFMILPARVDFKLAIFSVVDHGFSSQLECQSYFITNTPLGRPLNPIDSLRYSYFVIRRLVCRRRLRYPSATSKPASASRSGCNEWTFCAAGGARSLDRTQDSRWPYILLQYLDQGYAMDQAGGNDDTRRGMCPMAV